MRYLWFSNQIFQDAFGEDASSLCKEKLIIYIQQRDLAWGIRNDRIGYEHRPEVYHPNFYGRQLGFRQVIPVPLFESMHYGTYYRFCFPLEVTFWATRRSLEVMSKVVHKPITLNFECTPTFATWWEAKWLKKYEGDIREAHDRLFEQLIFKSYPKKEELENWKKVIHQKNQLLLMGILYCSYFTSLCDTSIIY